MGVKQVFWLVVQAMSLLSRLASVNSFAQNYNTPVHTLLLLRHGDSIWNGGEPGITLLLIATLFRVYSCLKDLLIKYLLQ